MSSQFTLNIHKQVLVINTARLPPWTSPEQLIMGALTTSLICATSLMISQVLVSRKVNSYSLKLSLFTSFAKAFNAKMQCCAETEQSSLASFLLLKRFSGMFI